MDYMEMEYPVDINLEATLFCGQAFRWKRAGDGYIGCVDNTAAYVRAQNGALFVRTQGGAADWAGYFDIRRDYEALAARYAGDEYVGKAWTGFRGMRVLNQPVWETLASFLISANNNIARITGILDRLCMAYGEQNCICGQPVYGFPAPEKIADAGEGALRALGLGYRAPYLHSTAQRLAAGYDLSCLREMGYAQALKELMAFKGVGEKVADCVLLFSCGYAEAFPLDVWMLRVMRALYGIEGKPAHVKAAALRLFGNDAGIVQQMLFHGARMSLFPELNA